MWAAGAAVPLVRLDFGISRTLASVHGIASGLGALLGARIAVTSLKYLSREALVKTTTITLFIGIFGLVLGPTIWITVPGCGLAAMSQSTISAIIMSQISHDDKPSMRRVLLQTGIGAAVGSSSILLMSAALHSGHNWRLPIFLGIFILGPLTLLVIRNVEFLDAPSSKMHAGTRSFAGIEKAQVYVIAGLLFFVEMGVGFWAIDLLISRGAGVALGALGAGLMGLSCALTRIILGVFNASPRALSIISVGFPFVGVPIICATNSPSLTMIGLIIAACGTGPLFSLAIVQISDGYRDSAERISHYMMGSALSYGVTPFFLALIFDNAGFIAGYLALLPALAIALLLLRRLGAHQEA